MLGAIAGDVIGSVYERHPIKTTAFPLFRSRSRFTDDTVLTVAVADAILYGGDYATVIRTYGRRYPRAGYGGLFQRWLASDHPEPYNSWGNGSAMRVSPVGYAFATVDEVLREARRTAEITHNHPEGIKGAQAAALAVFLARTGADKETIRAEIGGRFGYDLQRTVAQLRPTYAFDVSCQGSVPEALIAFLDAVDFEDAVRQAVSLGGDSDTLACIAGAIAEAHDAHRGRAIPAPIVRQVRSRLPEDFLHIIDHFHQRYPL
ncbi:MAG: ADP-ribosylglycohydrolase family protein [Anaerolineae bacterium]|nr:ADP-ribosylglycohydrolase family protein [Anaerolineae bacterium]